MTIIIKHNINTNNKHNNNNNNDNDNNNNDNGAHRSGRPGAPAIRAAARRGPNM